MIKTIKLILIIPFSKSLCLISKVNFFAILFLLLPFVSKADRYGCYVESYPFWIFHNEYGAMGGSPHYLFSSDNNNNPDTYYVRNGRCPLSINTPCYLYNYNGTLKATGYVTDFSMQNCPIDDYLPTFFIFTASMAWIQIRTRKNSMDENFGNNSCI